MKQKKLIAGIIISCFCMGFIFWRVNLREVISALSDFNLFYFIAGILFLGMGYAMRILRWSELLQTSGANISFKVCAAPFLGSIALNNILPMRLGDVMRALVFPASMGVSRVTSTGSLVIERLLDLVTLLICLGAGLFINGFGAFPHWVTQGIFGLSVLTFSGLLIVFIGSAKVGFFFQKISPHSWNSFQKLLAMLGTLFIRISVMSRPRIFFSTILISMFVWVGETGLFWCILKGCHLNPTTSIAMTVMAVATLSTLVPSSPGYIGPFHLAAYSAVTLLNGLPVQAASFALLAHLAVWLPTTLAGLVSMLIQPDLMSGLKLFRPGLEEQAKE